MVVVSVISLRRSARGCCRLLFNQCLCFTPETHDALLRRLCSSACLLRDLVLFVGLVPGGVGFLGLSVCKFRRTFCRRNLGEWQLLGLSAQSVPVVFRSARIVLLVDRVTLLAIFSQELKEALIAAKLDAGDLEIVPSFVEKRFDVAQVHRVRFFVCPHAIAAQKGAKSHVAVAASVVLAINAERVELLLVDSFAKVSTSLRSLHIAFQVWIDSRRLAIGFLADGFMAHALIIIWSGFDHSFFLSKIDIQEKIINSIIKSIIN